jgi:hypothetical protein
METPNQGTEVVQEKEMDNEDQLALVPNRMMSEKG